MIGTRTRQEVADYEVVCGCILCTLYSGFLDEAMKMWFDGGDGYVFTSVSEWLHGTNGQLLQSAAFALGNFARDGTSYILS